MKLDFLKKNNDSDKIKEPNFKLKFHKEDFSYDLIIDFKIKKNFASSTIFKVAKVNIDEAKKESFILPENTHPIILKMSKNLFKDIEKKIKKKYPFFNFYKNEISRAGIQKVDEEWVGIQIHYKGWN